jgi:hypothetical protein
VTDMILLAVWRLSQSGWASCLIRPSDADDD